MSDNTVLLISVILRGFSVIAAIGGVVYLAYHEKAGWGWLIFLAIVLGSYALKKVPDGQQVEQATILNIGSGEKKEMMLKPAFGAVIAALLYINAGVMLARHEWFDAVMLLLYGSGFMYLALIGEKKGEVEK